MPLNYDHLASSNRFRNTVGGVSGCLLALTVAACSGGDPHDVANGGTGGSIAVGPGGNAGTFVNGGGPTGTGGTSSVAGTGSGAAATVGGTLSNGGNPAVPAGGMGVINGAGSGGSAGMPLGGAPTGGTASGGAAGTSATAGSGGTHVRDHCVDGYEPHPADELMKDGYAVYVKSGQADTTVQPEVIEWFTQNAWQEAHFQWHNIRRCNGGMVIRNRNGFDPCKYTELIPADQEGKGPGDGLQFLAMHRHMIQSLKQLFPKHSEQFEGWDHFPQDKSVLPAEWQNDWTPFDSAMAQKMAMADDPAQHMSMWPTEGDFGQWIQTTSGIHGALHFKWVRPNNQDHGLGNQFTNIDNYLFWKMHGWIDKVWDRYRAAQGKTPNDPDIKAAVLKQCREMDQLAVLIKPELKPNLPGGDCTTPAPKQTGFFESTIRPIFESPVNKCTGCHGPDGANGNLTLGGSDCIKSSDIVANLVNKQSSNGGQFKLVVPGDPDKSWLYLKATGKAATAGCVPTNGVQCNPQIMPTGASAPTLTQAEQDALRQWILDGAPAPQ